MNETIETFKPQEKLPGIMQAGAVGFGLGIVTSFVIIATSLGLLFFFYMPVTEHMGLLEFPLRLAQEAVSGNVAYLATILLLVVAFFIVEEIFAIVPAMFGGGLIGLAEQLMAKYEHLNVQSTLIVGSLVGLAAGLITNAYVIPLATTGGGFLRDIYPGDSLWAGAIGVAWGVLQSLLLLNWFKRKMT